MSAVTPDSTASTPAAWWRTAVTYQVYIRSFADGNGDGLGDIAGLRSRLPYLAELGVDALWINPFYPSPQADGGYDVADYRAVDPVFGDLRAAEALITAAHDLGLRVLLDLVPNHTSDAHAWFQAALKQGPGAPARARYLFRPGKGEHGELPPNNWQAVFGGSAWERVIEADGQPGEWYLHLFDTRQPDLNWEHPEVQQEFLAILRFWFDRGVDGMRIDVAHGLFKDPAFPDLTPEQLGQSGTPRCPQHPHWDQEGVHEIYRSWRALADSYNPPRIFVAEAWVSSPERLARYLRPDELHTAFDFEFVRAPFQCSALRQAITDSLQAHQAVGAEVLWVLSNHDLTRHVTRLGRPTAGTAHHAPLQDKQSGTRVDLTLGRQRARALPGGVYLYQGEELGLEEVENLPDHVLQDPTFRRSGGAQRGRDGCRVPLPWTAEAPAFGFSKAAPWLPQPDHWGAQSAAAQMADPCSMWTFYQLALARRRTHVPSHTPLAWLEPGPDILAFTRGPGFQCILNLSPTPFPLPQSATSPNHVPVLSSAPLGTNVDEHTYLLPPDSAIWLAPPQAYRVSGARR